MAQSQLSQKHTTAGNIHKSWKPGVHCTVSRQIIRLGQCPFGQFHLVWAFSRELGWSLFLLNPLVVSVLFGWRKQPVWVSFCFSPATAELQWSRGLGAFKFRPHLWSTAKDEEAIASRSVMDVNIVLQEVLKTEYDLAFGTCEDAKAFDRSPPHQIMGSPGMSSLGRHFMLSNNKST